MPRRYCSIPEIGNLRKWFEKNFGMACQHHDAFYAMGKPRLQADLWLAGYMRLMVANKSTRSKLFVYWPTIGLTFIAVRLFGWTQYKG